MEKGDIISLSNLNFGLGDNRFYLISTNTHWRTPATPVHDEGPDFTSESCTSRPTEAANETKDTTYAIKSQSFNLQIQKLK